MNVEPRTGRFDVSFEIPGSAAARRLPLRFTGIVDRDGRGRDLDPHASGAAT